MNLTKTIAAAALACCVSTAANAQHDDDVILAVQGGQVVTGVMQGATFAENRLWLLDIGGGVINEPGYEAPSGTFPGSSSTGIAVLKALRAWDYDGGDFHAIANETVVITRFALSVESPLSDPCPGLQPSLPLGVSSASGSLHVHPWYELTAPTADGMYLLELEFWANPTIQPAIAKSKPFWIIFTKSEFDEKAIDEAVEWVVKNKVETPPPCLADLTGDGFVGVADLLALLAAWGPNPCHPADLVGDAKVGVADLLALLDAWGPCPR